MNSPWWRMQLFERVIKLRVGDTEISALDIAFEIEKDDSPEPNPCHVDIYNLSAENRATLSKYDKVPVVLEVGYENHSGIIFKGDMLSCKHLKEGPTWKTVLASGDGAMAIQTTRTNKSYAKGTPLKTVVKDLAKQLKIPSDNALKQMESLNQTLQRGFMVSGNPMAELSRVLDSQGFWASVQNSALQVMKKGAPVQKEAIALKADTGLIATPEVGSKGEITVQALINPEFAPGRQVYIESTVFKGFATIKRVRFDGASFGDAWGAEIIAAGVFN